MEYHIDFSKPFTYNQIVFFYFLNNDFKKGNYMGHKLYSLFDSCASLKESYFTIQELYEKALAVKSSQNKKRLYIVARDYNLIVFDISKVNLKIIKLPILEGICTINVINHTVIIESIFRILIVDTKLESRTIIDFNCSTNIQKINLQLNIDKRKDISRVKNNISIIDYSGDLHSRMIENKFMLLGVIGVLYTKIQFEEYVRSEI